VGGGALFFTLAPENAVLSDCNEELIELYKTVKREPQNIIEELKKMKNTEEEYYRVRSLDWKKMSKAEAAARMIFLNKTGFNGLYRVNRQGGFNVPYGKNEKTGKGGEENEKPCEVPMPGRVTIWQHPAQETWAENRRKEECSA
jgi:DNA adenine methylase